eukprot:7492582-Pyramimonas_sp.AAC.1
MVCGKRGTLSAPCPIRRMVCGKREKRKILLAERGDETCRLSHLALWVVVHQARRFAEHARRPLPGDKKPICRFQRLHCTVSVGLYR